MHCPYCGRSLGDGQRGLCPSCGLPIPVAPAAPLAEAPASPAMFAAPAPPASDTAQAAPASAPEASGFPPDLVPEVTTPTWTDGGAAPAAPAEPPAVSETVAGVATGDAVYTAPAAPPSPAEVPASTADAIAGTLGMPAAPAFAPAAAEPPVAEPVASAPPVAEPPAAEQPAPESAPASGPPMAEPTSDVSAMSQPPAAPEQPGQPSAPAQPAAPGMYPPGYPYPAPYPAPAQGQPAAPGYAPYGYGQPAAPSYPMYGQPAAPSYPMYGQPAPGSVPMMPAYGQPAPGSVPYYPQPGMMQPPVRKTNVGLIVGIVALVAVLVIGAIGGVLALRLGASPTPNGPPPGPGVTATAVAAATATAALNVVFQDSLLSNANGWADDSHCSFQSDGYHVKDGYICYAPAGNFTDSTVSVQVKQVAGDIHYFYGLVLRRASQGNFYEFDIDSNGKWAFGKVVNDTYTEIVPFVAHSAIKHGLNATNTLTVMASGTHFVFFVNGTQVGQANDSTFSRGYCGVEGDDHLEVVFTNFSIATPS